MRFNEASVNDLKLIWKPDAYKANIMTKSFTYKKGISFVSKQESTLALLLFKGLVDFLFKLTDRRRQEAYYFEIISQDAITTKTIEICVLLQRQ